METKSMFVTGEYWSFDEPTIYTFNYFNFKPAVGGQSDEPAELHLTCYAAEESKLLKNILTLHGKYPYSTLIIRRGSLGLVDITIWGEMLFDFDMLFACEIEALIENSDGGVNPVDRNVEVHLATTVYYRSDKRKSRFMFQDEGVFWIHSSADKVKGLRTQRLSINIHHKSQPAENNFINELLQLLDESKIEYLEYQAYLNNYNLRLGNGRQGLSANTVNIINFETFRDMILILISKYGFILGRDKELFGISNGMVNHNILMKSPVKVVKDDRKS